MFFGQKEHAYVGCAVVENHMMGGEMWPTIKVDLAPDAAGSNANAQIILYFTKAQLEDLQRQIAEELKLNVEGGEAV